MALWVGKRRLSMLSKQRRTDPNMQAIVGLRCAASIGVSSIKDRRSWPSIEFTAGGRHSSRDFTTSLRITLLQHVRKLSVELDRLLWAWRSTAFAAICRIDILCRGNRLNFDKPLLVEYTRHNHGSCRTMVAEKLLANLAVHEPILPIGEKRCYFD
jgi:hypothetical protein